MSLSEAVLEVAKTMREESEERRFDVELSRVLKSYARQLETVVKAVEGEARASIAALAVPPEMQHILEIEKARAEFRKPKNIESKEPIMTEIVDGPLAGDYVSVEQDMPISARTSIDNNFYYLGEDKKLHLCSASNSVV